ncbi:MAG: DNA cytosine methyltransferase [Bacteroidetes bacterium HGW-Bacteroidetes-4]|jgi:DNA (cytosine-5)-methyltransferase 1|nr:MAG: DNA cytosine methyltransferase [Bacteroidetes bacterium HGW-Bacteroidetes-4]
MKIFYIDLFSGAGGTTTGIHLTNNDNIKVVACVNHDAKAIESHKANHPDCLHFVEDVRDLKVVDALYNLVRKLRKDYPGCIINIWASLECTNYSKAKGGLPRDADSRTLAYALYNYAEKLSPDNFFIENVREFMSWGPLDKNGKPVSKLNGRDYIRWIKQMCSYGYYYDWKLLNSADFGAYTSRERYFGQFAKNNMPITWPEPTHAKKIINGGLFNNHLKPWKAVKEVLDLQDEGESIFNRKKPLVDATLKRIYAGLIKFVAGGEQEFLLKYNSMNRNGKYQAPDINEPCPVVSTQGRLAITSVERFTMAYNSGNDKHRVKSENEPIGTLTTQNSHAVVKASFLNKNYSGCPKSKVASIDKPAGTITTIDHHSLVNVRMLTSYYGNSSGAQSVDEPCPTITTKDRFSAVFIDQQYGTGKPASVSLPAGTLTAVPKLNIVQAKWLMDTNFRNVGSSLDEPGRVITASRKHHYLMNPQYNDKGRSLDRPCFTLIARMDKMPPYLVNVDSGQMVIVINEMDSDIMKKIKEFMALYGIIDIKMRMLKVPELLKIQGFPANYILKGTKADQKKFIGNAVVPVIAKAIAKANANALIQKLHKAI